MLHFVFEAGHEALQQLLPAGAKVLIDFVDLLLHAHQYALQQGAHPVEDPDQGDQSGGGYSQVLVVHQEAIPSYSEQ